MEVKTIAVIGAGTMGRGIAYVAALGGYPTILEDVSGEILEHAQSWLRTSFEEAVQRGKLNATTGESALARIATVSTVEQAVRDSDLIIEAIPESLELKRELFTLLQKAAKPNAIFASNTSSLSISEFADELEAAGHCIGMHFFNPVPKMKLVELVRTAHTSEEALVACHEVATRMGKQTVVVKEAPGFITSRINALIGNEAFAILEAGIASAHDIDKAVKLGLNHPMGPFEMVDLVGLDVRLKILEYLHCTLGEKYRPSPILRRYVQEGRLGRKSGRGVYTYEQ